MNPPFVIAPTSGRMWRDSGMRGDEFCRKVVREAPEYLSEGGFLQLIGNWPHVAGRDWKQDLAAWVEGTGCDAWALKFDTHDPASYALSWLDFRPGENVEEKTQQLAEWVEFLEREGIEAISYGVLTLRKRTAASHWFACDEIPAPERPCGDAVLAAFRRRDVLASLPEDALLLQSRVRLTPELRWEQQLAPSESGWSLQQARVILAGGLGIGGPVDGAMVALLQRCRGERCLRDLLAELADSQKWDPAAATPAFLRVIRVLLEKGFLDLIPSQPPSQPPYQPRAPASG
jgi:hypothetical protein